MTLVSRVAVTLAAAVLLLGLVLASTAGPLAALASVIVAAGVLGLVALGPERLGVALLVGATFFGPLSAVRPVPSIDVVTASDVFLGAGMVLLLPTLLRNRFDLPFSYQIGALLILVSGVVSSLLTDAPLVSLRYLGQLMVAMVLLPMFLAWWGPRIRMVHALAWGYVLGQATSFVFALAEGSGRSDGLTTHPNFFGLCSVLAFSLTLFLIPRVGPVQRRVLLGLDVCFVVGVSISGSRAALLALVLVFVAWVLVRRSALGGYALVSMGVLAVAVGSWALEALPEGSAVSRLAGNTTSTVSDNAREDLLRSGVQEFLAHPLLGTGFVNALESHSIYLEIAVAGGLLGLIGYLLVLGSLLRPLLDRPNPLHALSYPVLAYALVGAFSNSLWDRFIWTAAWLAAIAMTRDGDPAGADGVPDDQVASRVPVTAGAPRPDRSGGS